MDEPILAILTILLYFLLSKNSMKNGEKSDMKQSGNTVDTVAEKVLGFMLLNCGHLMSAPWYPENPLF